MRLRSILPGPLCLVLGATPPADAATTSDAGLAALVRQAIEVSPALAALDRRIDAARERVTQAGALPNPSLGVSYTNDGWAPSLGSMEMTNLGVMLGQPLPYPGKRAATGRSLDGERRQLEATRKRLALAIEEEVSRAWVDLVEANARHRVIERQRGLWRQTAELGRSTFGAGTGALQDALRADVEERRLGAFLAQAGAAAIGARGRINALLRRRLDEPVAAPEMLEAPGAPPAVEAYAELARTRLPELAALDAERTARRADAELAELGGRPDFELEAGYMFRGTLPPMWQLGLRVGLPVWRASRVQPGIREKRASLAAVDFDEERILLRLRQLALVRIAELTSLREVVELYERRILPLDQDSLDAALAGYRAGRNPFLNVLEAMQTVFRDRLAAIEAGAAAHRVSVALATFSLEEGSAMIPSPASMGAGLTSAPATGGAPRATGNQAASSPGGGM